MLSWPGVACYWRSVRIGAIARVGALHPIAEPEVFSIVPPKPRRPLKAGWSSRSLGLVGGTVGALLVLGAASLSSRAGEDVTVSQHNREFTPGRLAVKRGTVVHIVNDDRVTHHIFIDTPAMRFDSGEQPIGKIVDLPFDRSGNFPVQCAIHPTMHLEVVVD